MNSENISYLNNQSNCEIHKILNTNEYFTCYKYFVAKNTSVTIFQISLIVGCLIFNSIVITLMIISKQKLTVFDHILFGHTIVDTVSSLFCIPLYHIFDIFGYTPFPRGLSYFWVITDNAINFVSSFHMLYGCFVRYRSIQSPKNYNKEFIILKPWIVMSIIWIIGFVVWISITVCKIYFILTFNFSLFFIFDNLNLIAYGLVPFTIKINYFPVYIKSIAIFITWLLPMIGILFFTM